MSDVNQLIQGLAKQALGANPNDPANFGNVGSLAQTVMNNDIPSLPNLTGSPIAPPVTSTSPNPGTVTPAAMRYGQMLNATRKQNIDPQAAIGGAPQNQYQTYKVKKGDTLWGIAQQYLGNGQRWHELEGFHGDPHALQIGTVIHIPKQGGGNIGQAPSNVSSNSPLNT